MRIAHVTATFPPYKGGTGNVCYHNAVELVRRGHTVHVYTAAVPGAKTTEDMNDVIVQRLEPLIRVGNAPLLPGLVRVLHGFDLIHLHYPFYGGEITALIAKLSHTPLVVTYHQDVILTGLMGIVERILRQTICRAALTSAQRLLFTSLDYGRASCVYPMLRSRESVLDELPNGVDTALFNNILPTGKLRSHLHLVQSDRVLLLVANLDRAHYFKGVGLFLKALAQVPSNVKGIIVGDGNVRSTYESMAEGLGIRHRCLFVGRVQDEELPVYYRLADVTVLPSTTKGEAFGLVLLESMACGTPVIATNLPGVRTVVDHEKDGLLVEPDDLIGLIEAIRQMLNNELSRRMMGCRGRMKTESRYDWSRIGARLEFIYRNVLDESHVYQHLLMPWKR